MIPDILKRFAQFAEPLIVPPQWHRLRDRARGYRGSAQPERVLRELRWAFSAADLVTAGVARQGSHDLELWPSLAQPYCPFVLLREPSTGEPYSLLTHDGLVGVDGPRLAATVQAVYQHEATGEPTARVYVTHDLHDAMLLRAVGLPAVFDPSQTEWTRDELAGLVALCRTVTATVVATGANAPEPAAAETPENTAEQPPTQTNAATAHADDDLTALMQSDPQAFAVPRFEILLLAWTPSGLQPMEPSRLSGKLRQVLQLERALNRDFSAIGIWSPDPATLDDLRLALEFGEPDEVRQLLERSVAHECLSIAGYLGRHVLAGPPADLAALSSKLDQLAREPAGLGQAEQLQETLARYRNEVDARLIVPLVEEALSHPNAVRRNEQMALADEYRLLHELGLRAQLSLARRNPRTDGKRRYGDLYEYLNVARHITASHGRRTR